MKCFVVFAALAVAGFVSATPADDAAAITSDATALGSYYKTVEKASVDIVIASFTKDITKYTNTVIAFKSLLETRLSLLGGQSYWQGLSSQIDAATSLTNVWGNAQIKAQTGPYLADYNQLVVNPMVTSLKAIAKTVKKSTIANLKATCYDNNMNMASSTLSMVANQVGWTMDPMLYVLSTITMNLQMVMDAPTMQMSQACMNPTNMMLPDLPCLLNQTIANGPALLDAFSYFQGNATSQWNSTLAQTLQQRGMMWGWGMPQQPGMSMNPLMISSNFDMIASCIANPPPPMPPM